MSVVSTQIYSGCTLPAKAGTEVKIKVDQSVLDESTPLLDFTGPREVRVLIDGPRVQLNTDDIAGVYPAAGSQESADEFLPHIALNRRSLPWERSGMDADAQKPWLALVLFKESELKLPTNVNGGPKGEPEAVVVSDVQAKDPLGYPKLSAKLGNSAPITVLYVRNDVWSAARPNPLDLRYLTHVRRTTIDGTDSYTSIVICNRLPDAGDPNETAEMHTACLISLEGRSDLWDNAGRPSNNAVAALVVLHHWRFRPSKGGDFEQVIRSIRFQPNGGVLRFGNLPQKVAGHPAPLSGGFEGVLNTGGYFLTPLLHSQEGNVTWRGPLRPFDPPARSLGFAIRSAPEEFADPQPGESLDYSHATAFELGRLLALNNPGILDDMREMSTVIEIIKPDVAINKLPEVLQKPDWVQQEENWYEQPWEFEGQISAIKNEAVLVGNNPGDVGGINDLPGGWGSDPIGDLGSLPSAQVPVVVAIPIDSINVGSLGKIYADVESAAHGG